MLLTTGAGYCTFIHSKIKKKPLTFTKQKPGLEVEQCPHSNIGSSRYYHSSLHLLWPVIYILTDNNDYNNGTHKTAAKILIVTMLLTITYEKSC